jgi:hypothetical protein
MTFRPWFPGIPLPPALRRVTALLALAAAPAAHANMFQDAALDALFAAQKFNQLEQAAAARYAAATPDPQAVLATALSVLQGNDAARRLAVIAQAQTCVQRDPKAAACHYAYGVTLGFQAISEGMLKAASSVGRIRSALNEAVALDPAWFAARSAAVEFYLAAPALAGGSVSKAQELARTAPTPEQARALQARLLLHEDKPEAALPLLAQARSTTDSALAADLRSWTVSAGAQLINNGQGEKARALFEQMQREQPQNAMAPYFLARVHSDAGQHEQALKLLEAAATLAGAQRLPIDYRAGISLQALGNKEAARQALNRYVSAGKGSKKSMEDARKRLEQLAG